MISLLMLTENDREEHSKSTSVVVMRMHNFKARNQVWCSPFPLSHTLYSGRRYPFAAWAWHPLLFMSALTLIRQPHIQLFSSNQ